MTTGLWAEPGVPHKGWVCVDLYDHCEGDDDCDLIRCEMCDARDIRFVHVMRHANYEDDVLAGSVCAENMAEGYAAKAVEKSMRQRAQRRASRRSRWLGLNWRAGKKPGTQWLKKDGHFLGVFARGAGWGYWIDEEFGQRSYLTRDEAKLALFDAFFDIIDPK